MMKGLYMSKRLQMFLGVAVLTCAGCGMEPPPNMTPRINDLPKAEANDSQTVERVRRITAKLLGVALNRVNPDTTLADLGADELDLVELTMELEEAFSTTIPDEALEKLAGEGNWETGMKKITIQKLADTVERQSRTQSK